MNKNNKPPANDYLPLSKALAIVAAEHPWAPLDALRNAVRQGRVPSYRSSDRPKAWYYVRVADLFEALPKRGITQPVT